MSAFVPGLALCGQFYDEAVRPVLDATHPGMAHGAALLGRGSEVLGFDDEMSTDHDWKARVVIFLCEEDRAARGAAVEEALRRQLPPRFRGHPVGFEIHTVRSYCLERLAVDLDDTIAARDWLTLPEHGLRTFTAGAVYRDDVGLQAARDRLAYYPRDVWLYLLVAGWWRIHPEANLVGRAGYAGDELGSALIGSSLVTDVMRLCFLMERQYAPYSKWFGTAFARLPCGPALTPILRAVVQAETWQHRERALMAAYEQLAALHNSLQLTEPIVTEIEQMWDRPFKVVWADAPGRLRALIRDPEVVRIAERWPAGPVDRFRDLLFPGQDRSALLRVFDETLI